MRIKQKKIRWLLEEKYNGESDKQFKKDVERLNDGEPLDYVIGFTEFLGCKIDLSKRPLIPRPETEFWVEQAIKQIKENILVGAKIPRSWNFCTEDSRKLRILDMFSGSGCIGIAVLKHIKNSLCDFADIDKRAIEQTKINCKLNKINQKRYKVIQSDVFKNVRVKYDFVFANPPYVAKTRKNKIQNSVLKYEPQKALFGGADGLFYIRKFLKDAKNHLKPCGRVYMEFDSPQKKQIEKLLKKFDYSGHKFYKDQYGKWRYVVIK